MPSCSLYWPLESGFTRDDVALNFVGPFTEGVEAGIAPQTLHIAFDRIARAGQQLHSVVRDVLQALRTHHLGLCRFFAAPRALIDEPREVIQHEPGLIDPRLHVGDAVRDGLELAERLPPNCSRSLT